MSQLRFCLIGTGRAGLVHAWNLGARIKRGELVALCDANPEALTNAARELNVTRLYNDYRQAVRDPEVDAVIIVTPTFLHCEIASEAARNNKHIFLEKPMAITVKECRTIMDAVNQNGVKLQIGFMRRFDEGFLQAKEKLESGQLGSITTIKSTGRGPGLPPSWSHDISKSNGLLAEVNSHDFDSVRWLVGADLKRVYAEADNYKCADLQNQYPDFYDNVLVNLRFKNGVIGSIDGACPCGYGYDARTEILCTGGVIMIGSIENDGVSTVTIDGGVIRNAHRSWRNRFKDAYLAELEHFIDCVLNDRTPRVTGLDGLQAVNAVVAANQSIRLGQPVVLPDVQ
ncbi:MAG: Gfo/Idh/MocA family oxidoreductase [bacterium]|nr:Gfo/Idh/MocA family oxidoreductase [Candidatus Sumerlaeota bacterium]